MFTTRLAVLAGPAEQVGLVAVDVRPVSAVPELERAGPGDGQRFSDLAPAKIDIDEILALPRELIESGRSPGGPQLHIGAARMGGRIYG